MDRYLRRLPLAAVAVCAALIAGCGGSSSDDSANTGSESGAETSTAATSVDTGDRTPTAETQKGGTLKVALIEDVGDLDPTKLETIYAWQALSPMCDSLYRLDTDARPEPWLATAFPELSDGGRTVTIKLRTGVKFNDDTEFNAEAVKSSLELAKKQSPFFASAPIESIEVSSPSEVTIHLEKPYAPLTSDLAGPAGMIVSPTQVQKLGKKFGDDPVCVGAFKYGGRVAGQSLTLVRSPLYYEADQITLDKIQFEVIADESARVAAVQSGEIQVAENVSGSLLPGLESNPDLQVVKSTGLGFEGLFVNVANSDGVGKPHHQLDTPLAKSAEVRQALSLSLDREALAQIAGGATIAGCSPISPISDLYDNPECPEQDMAKAKELIEKSGYPTPIKATLVTPTGKEGQRKAQAIQSMAREAGFDLTIESCDVAVCIERQLNGEYDVTTQTFGGLPDPDSNISVFFLTDSFFGITGAASPKFDQIMAEARAANDPEKRIALYKQGLDQLRAESATIFLVHPGYDIVARSEVTGYVFTPAGLTYYQNAGFVAG